MFSEADLVALELMVRAGKVDGSIPWAKAIPEVRAFILQLAAALRQPEEVK